MDDEITTYSISIRLRRTTTEFTFVSVPVTGDIMIVQPDGSGRIDTDKLAQLAIEMGDAPDRLWQIEGQVMEPHPIQTPPPGYADDGDGR